MYYPIVYCIVVVVCFILGIAFGHIRLKRILSDKATRKGKHFEEYAFTFRKKPYFILGFKRYRHLTKKPIEIIPDWKGYK